MTDFAAFTPDQAREVWDTIKLLRSSGLLRNISKLSRPNDPGIHQVFVKNTSGEEIPPFACMQVDGTEVIGALTYIKVKKPTVIDSQYLFNHDTAIEIAGHGMCLPWDVVRMRGTASSVNKCYGVTVGGWDVQEEDAGPFVVFGSDNTRSGILRGRFKGGGDTLERFTLLQDLADGTALATIQNMDGEEIETDTVRDPLNIFEELVIGAEGLAMRQCGKHYVIQAPCPE